MTSDTLSAVLWDMDGTLIDSEPLWIRAELAMLDRFGIRMSAETHRRLIGSGLWDAAEHFRELGVPMPVDEIVAEWVAGVADDLRTGPVQWRPGAVALLDSLNAAGIPCALVTMSVRSLAESVAAMLPDDSFQVIIAGDEVVEPKPHPEPYLRGAAALGVSISSCLAFEDSPTGLRSAYAAGAVAVGIPNLLDLRSTPAHRLLETLEGLDAHSLHELFVTARSNNEETDSV